MSLEVPPEYAPPPPPKKIVRPKITLQIPDASSHASPRGPPTATSVYWGPNRYHGRPAGTPASHISDPQNPYFNPFLHMYHNKASEFMFKQFEGFKDFTMNTAKSGLSVGEKSAFWFYNKLRLWSKKWFTHFFLTICLALYSFMGAAMFMALEGPHEENYVKNITLVREEMAMKIHESIFRNHTRFQDRNFDILSAIVEDLKAYEANYTECMKHTNNDGSKKKTWTFWNSLFYAGTIYTTIDVMASLQEP
ncbi:uncharacterized protein LOC106130640 [Amyelois transitella]|uniref:uncharacterized protein LOC106130640 n=1 Tax=Amyelois transitella TaxID=680683 RepID=UPI00067C6DF5|nr:uncharacterized protein LOC106130640 [Amyelois transitella]